MKKKNNNIDFTKMEKVTSNVSYVDDGFHLYLSYKARIVLFVISVLLLLFGAYWCVTKSYDKVGLKKLGYNENANASNYKVNVVPSELIPNGELDPGMTYVKDNIESIIGEFKYNVYFSDLVDVRYEYKVDSNLYIYGDDDKLMVPVQVTPILDTNYVNLRDSNKFNLKIPVRLNYKEYYDKVNNYFKENNVTGKAKVVVSLDIISTINYSRFDDIVSKKNSVKMEIPLTSDNNQIQIYTTNYNDDGHFDRVMTSKPSDEGLLYLGLVMFVLAIITIVYFITFIFRSVPKKSKYVLLRDGLLKEFDQRIVNVKEVPIGAGQNIIDCYSFSELLDAQDTLKKPILYCEIVRNQKCMFVIVDESNIFRYVLKEVDLEYK